ncbi:YbfB/YjiJ family MFS transporter [Camelimonas fluminis]|uniref:YbfB/YjiJ family MFS transporter n=1 Tax=Camelimonas fluminis TaxID=1576911 RepID=A0ABV7UFB2_9HYPH|nr:YbfB/YjiJ family MFS transporter [Camelimonas fluminis]
MRQTSPQPAPSLAAGSPAVPPPWRLTASAMCAMFIGIGLARFAYTPLMPALVGQNWFNQSQAAYIGAANLAGYFIGALLSRKLASGNPRLALQASMIACAVSFFACAWPSSFLWFSFWRFLAGFAGAVALVTAAPFVLPFVPEKRRGFASGMIFVGPAIGVTLGALLVPWLVTQGLTFTWLALGVVCALVTALGWSGWPPAPAKQPAGAAAVHAPAPHGRSPAAVATLLAGVYAVYALSAFGLVPHMIFLADYVARGLNWGLTSGAMYWALFGVGAMLGPVITGACGDHFGFRATLRVGLVLQMLGVGVLAVSADPFLLAASSILIGAFVPGVAVLTMGRLREVAPADRIPDGWRIATVGFAVGQAAAGYIFSWVFARTHDYPLLFGVGAGIIVLALAVELTTSALAARRNRAT